MKKNVYVITLKGIDAQTKNKVAMTLVKTYDHHIAKKLTTCLNNWIGGSSKDINFLEISKYIDFFLSFKDDFLFQNIKQMKVIYNVI